MSSTIHSSSNPQSSSSSSSSSASPIEPLINALRARYVVAKPQDPLQFCADFFISRLSDERSQLLLTQQRPPHSSVGMNPAQSGGIHRVDEEDESAGSPTNTTTSRSAAKVTSASTMDAPSPSSTGGTATAATGSRDTSSFANFGGFDPHASSNQVGSSHLPTNYNLNRRTSVSAESLTPSSTLHDNWSPPNHPKSPEQLARLRKAVMTNFLFSKLADEQASQVLGALQEKPIPKEGIKVIQQGDVGDYFYVVEAGSFDIFVNPSGKLEPGPDGLGTKVTTVGPGGSFGELALMYNAPRAATVVSTETSTLWALDRVTFRRILMDAAFARRRMYEGFLAEVPLLTTLTAYERSKIADALETAKFSAGGTIIKEGDPGDAFFILESGTAEVFRNDTKGCVKTYAKGDYFGELALLNDAPRAASVIAKTDVKCARLSKDGFSRLLGSVEGIMRRNDPSRAKDADEVDPLSKA